VKDAKEQPSEKQKTIEVVFLSVFIFVILFALIFMGYQKVFAQKIFFGVKVGIHDIGGKSKAEAKDEINKYIESLNKKSLTVYINDKTLNPSMKDLGIFFDSETMTNQAFSYGRSPDLLNKLVQQVEAAVSTVQVLASPTIDVKKFAEYFSKNSDVIREAKNATLRVDDGQLVVVLSEVGNEIDLQSFRNDLKKNIAINKIDNQINIQLTTIIPEIDENQIVLIKPAVEKIVNNPITVIVNNVAYVANVEKLASWIVLKAKKNSTPDITFSDDSINEFIKNVALKTDKSVVNKKVNSQTGAVINEGSDGMKLNQAKLLTDIKNILNDSQKERTATAQIDIATKSEVKVDPEVAVKSGGTPGLFEGKYIEINLTEQMLYAYDGTNLVHSYQVSTGKWSTPTPIGTRHIESKTNRAYSSKYGLYMPWWMSLGGGYGIHELPEWPNGTKEGESHLGTPVSHGCIRLGVDSAQTMYDWADTGTPVNIHK